MSHITRIEQNPFLIPDKQVDWKSLAAFNPSVIQDGAIYHVLYRAQSKLQNYHDVEMSLSTIGYANSNNGIDYKNHKQLIVPEEKWEQFGCEDPRVTKLGDTYYIFYTALSKHPFVANAIRVAVAMTKDFKTIDEKHLVTSFNAKAMALFPEKIQGKYAAILTAHTDIPPAKICIAYFDTIDQLWSEPYWDRWYTSLDEHVLPLLRSSHDHLEVGATPVKTDQGWLLIYSYIQHYFESDKRVFGIEAILLDLDNPFRVIGRTKEPLFFPEKSYELHGNVSHVIFPSGARVENNILWIYYGASDTTCCAATIPLDELLKIMQPKIETEFSCSQSISQGFKRYNGNPIISPRSEFAWEANGTFNPAVIYDDQKFHIIYRAMSHDNTSVFGYASSKDGIRIDERLSLPIYTPTEIFEQKLRPGNSGCEDPRITKLNERYYIFYTAFDGYTPRVAFTSIACNDFINHQWRWDKPVVITPPGIDDKDACILSKKIKNKYVVFHRAENSIRINFLNSLTFSPNQYLEHSGYLIKPRKEYWDNRKFGIAAPPIETQHGWLLFFHRVTTPGSIYKIEAIMLDINDPSIVVAETDATLMEPEMNYEKFSQINNVIFPCGAVLLNKEIYLYYGAGDFVVGVAKMTLDDIFKRLGY